MKKFSKICLFSLSLLSLTSCEGMNESDYLKDDWDYSKGFQTQLLNTAKYDVENGLNISLNDFGMYFTNGNGVFGKSLLGVKKLDLGDCYDVSFADVGFSTLNVSYDYSNKSYLIENVMIEDESCEYGSPYRDFLQTSLYEENAYAIFVYDYLDSFSESKILEYSSKTIFEGKTAYFFDSPEKVLSFFDCEPENLNFRYSYSSDYDSSLVFSSPRLIFGSHYMFHSDYVQFDINKNQTFLKETSVPYGYLYSVNESLFFKDDSFDGSDCLLFYYCIPLDCNYVTQSYAKTYISSKFQEVNENMSWIEKFFRVTLPSWFTPLKNLYDKWLSWFNEMMNG
jgi:hypothetical protein